MSRLMIVALVFVLVGCAPTWTRPNTSAQELARDEYDCIQETREPAPQTVMMVPQPTPYGYPRGATYYAPQTWDGFTIARNMRSRNAYRACMKARGYQEE